MPPDCIEPPHGPVRQGVLLERENRYRARVRIAGDEHLAHVPNPGRMAELMLAGRPVHLVAAPGEHRVTSFDLVAVEHEGLWVCIDNRLGSRLIRRALGSAAMPELLPYQTVEREVRCGASRLDFRLSDPGTHWVELKSCTLIVNGLGRFPDAPTARGRRHLGELAARATAGDQATALFLIQRPDALGLGPNHATDPAFAAALAQAAAAGVETLAYTSDWTRDGLRLLRPAPVTLG